ncbi:hypothetical protein APHAL10511_001410 [Amanita phalloides]|nr:hypothetical protein APHAL10511_001410 [Amanita phalloides]
MGSTGTGKSSFIKLLSGDSTVHVGDNLESETSTVQVVPFRDRESGRNVIIVDTPGFDDSRAGVTDTDILKTIATFLLEAYDKDRKLNGLIYVQRISDPRFGGQSGRNLKMFRSLCGANAYENVVVLTTFWDQLPSEQEGAKREEQLKTTFFKDLVEGGARFMRHDRTIENAHDVLRHISMLVPKNVQIQEEIRLEGKTLENTAAGSVHREEVERIIAKHNKEMVELKDELETMRSGNGALRQQLEEERARLQREIARWEDEKVELKIGLTKAKEAQERLEAGRAKEKADAEKWRQDQERDFISRFEAQEKRYSESVKILQDQLDQGKKAREDIGKQKDESSNAEDDADYEDETIDKEPKRRQQEEAVRVAVERALQEEREKSYAKKGWELGGKIPLVVDVVGKPLLGALGLGLDTSRKVFRKR